MISTPKRTKQEAPSMTCPPPPTRTRTTSSGAHSSSPSPSLFSSFTSTTSLEYILAEVDLSEGSSTMDVNGFAFLLPRPPPYPCLSDDDDVHQDGPCKLHPRPSRQRDY
eukprot:scaffold8682_cov136-Skeletonema_marinoi.AAC.2